MNPLSQAGGAEAAIIIPHFNDVARLQRCLAALIGCKGFERVETVVVDNRSTDDVATVMAAFPAVRLVVEERKGAGAARNRGVRETTARRLMFLDCDCVPEPDWIEAGIASLDGEDVVGGRVSLFDETPPPRSGAEAFETVMAFRQPDYIHKKGFSVSANLLTWRGVFDTVGGFGVGMSEDVDWCHRARDHGFRLAYKASVHVVHPTRSTTAALEDKWRRMVRETFELCRHRPAMRTTWALRALAVLLSPALHAARFLTDPHLASMTERLRGIGMLVRLRTRRAIWMLRQIAGLPI